MNPSSNNNSQPLHFWAHHFLIMHPISSFTEEAVEYSQVILFSSVMLMLWITFLRPVQEHICFLSQLQTCFIPSNSNPVLADLFNKQPFPIYLRPIVVDTGGFGLRSRPYWFFSQFSADLFAAADCIPSETRQKGERVSTRACWCQSLVGEVFAQTLAKHLITSD